MAASGCRRFIHSVCFNGPNGIALEASWWVVDPTGCIAAYADPELFADPDPVPAVRELQRTGQVATARTRRWRATR